MPSLFDASKIRSLDRPFTLKSMRQAVAGSPRLTRRAAFFLTVRRTRSAVLRAGRSVAGGSFGSGLVAGLYLVGFAHPLISRFGGGSTFFAAAVAATAFALFLGSLFVPARTRVSQLSTMVLCTLLALWAIAFGWLGGVAGLSCRSIALESFAAPVVQFAIGCAVSLFLIGVPVFCAARLSLLARSVRVGWLLVGAALGMIAAAHIVGPCFGIQWALWIAAACSFGVIATRASQPGEAAASPAAAQFASAQFSVLAAIGPHLAAAAAGTGAAGLGRLTLQLFPSAEAAQWTAWAGFLLGTAAGWSFARRGFAEQRRQRVARIVLASAVGVALPVLLFGTITDWFLGTTAGVSQVALLMLIRAGSAAVLFAPLGAAWGALVSLCHRRTGDDSVEAVRPFVLSVPALLAGAVAARWLLSFNVGVPMLTGCVAIVFALLGVGLSLRGTARSRLWPEAVAFAAIVALAGAGYRSASYHPARAARLLFSTDVFMERNAGTESRLLPFLDDARLVAVTEGDRGTYTLWKHHGVQLELRENGIPRGTYCSQPEICPQYSGQSLTVALPLTLHESPRRMLLLGLGSGSTLAASLEFPVADVTCVEGDPRLVELLEQKVWPSGPSNPRTDNRVRILAIDPAVAVHSRPGGFDVIAADTDPASVADGGPYFTRDFYAGVRSQLGVDGIFAQRFQYVDFGPWPVCSVLATLKSVFADVAAIEAGGGDLILLATNSPRGLDRPELFERFQSPQVKRSLSQAGWDWSVALNLGAYWGEGCESLASGAPTNTASNGLFVFRLPQETMRWGAKGNELAKTLNPHSGRLAEWPDVEGNDPEFLRRLSDVLLERELMTAYPDQPWAYRKAVHDELKKHPHTVISDAGEGFDRQLHPVDQRRLNYFSALGKAARARTPSLDALRELEEFAEPYDPVLTYFVHHELASLYARTGGLDPAAHLRHRLYTVYYGDARDRSIRDVVEALQLLAASPQVLPATERWDHMNALLQFLKLRWNNRGLDKPASVRIVLNDLDRTIGAAEQTFSEMEKLRLLVGVSESDWFARREVLERSLVRPLRAYQSGLVPDYLKELNPPATAANQRPASTRQNAN